MLKRLLLFVIVFYLVNWNFVIAACSDLTWAAGRSDVTPGQCVNTFPGSGNDERSCVERNGYCIPDPSLYECTLSSNCSGAPTTCGGTRGSCNGSCSAGETCSAPAIPGNGDACSCRGSGGGRSGNQCIPPDVATVDPGRDPFCVTSVSGCDFPNIYPGASCTTGSGARGSLCTPAVCCNPAVPGDCPDNKGHCGTSNDTLAPPGFADHNHCYQSKTGWIAEDSTSYSWWCLAAGHSGGGQPGDVRCTETKAKCTIQGRKVVMPGSLEVPPAIGQKIDLDGYWARISNPYFLNNIQANGNHTVSSTVPNGFAVASTLNYNGGASVKTNGATRVVDTRLCPGGIATLWWLYTPVTCTGVGPPGNPVIDYSLATYDVFAYGVANATSVIFEVGSSKSGIVQHSYAGVNLGGGTWRATIDFAAYHSNQSGPYNVQAKMDGNVLCGRPNFVRNAAPALSSMRIKNSAGTVVAYDTGNKAHICMAGFNNNRTVTFQFFITDNDGWADVKTARMRWRGVVTDLTINAASSWGNTAVAEVTISYTAANDNPNLSPVELAIWDSAVSTGWFSTPYSWKVWDCNVPLSGNMYDSSAVATGANCSTGAGFTTLADAAMNFLRVGVGATIYSASSVSAYSAGNLRWGNTYTVVPNADLSGSGVVTRWKDSAASAIACGATKKLDNSLIDPYDTTPSLKVDFAATLNVAAISCTSVGPPGNPNVSTALPTYDVFAYGVSGATTVDFKVWSQVGGLGSAHVYAGTNLGGGTWRATINFAAFHGNASGIYEVEGYMDGDVFCDSTNFTRNGAPALSLMRLKNSSDTVVPFDAGNRGQICDPGFGNDPNPRSVTFEFLFTDPDGWANIQGAKMRWKGTETDLIIDPLMSLGTIAVARATIDYLPASNSSVIAPVEVDVWDDTFDTGWVTTIYNWKVWDCIVPLSGDMYDGSDQPFGAQCALGLGFANYADNTMNFKSVSINSTVVNASNAHAYTANNVLIWPNTYLIIPNPDLAAGSSVTRWINQGTGTTYCGSQFSLDAVVDPYSTESLKVDFSSVLAQEPWFSASGGGIQAGRNIVNMIPSTCGSGNGCVPAMSINSIGTSDNGLISGQSISNNSGCTLGSGCFYGQPNNWYKTSSTLSSAEKYNYQYFLDKYFGALGLGTTMIGGATMTDVKNKGGKGVFLVNGDFNVDTDNSVAVGDFLMMIVKGKITFDTAVNATAGIFLADGGVLATGGADNQLVIDGMLYSSRSDQNITFTRGFNNISDNNRMPAVMVKYRPDLLFNMPSTMLKVMAGWKQY